jgi:hypothetical protein
VGNSFSEEPVSGNYDAGIGLCAIGCGDGTFDFVMPDKSAFSARTDARNICPVVVNGTPHWLVTSNGAPLMMFGKTPDGSAAPQLSTP